MDVCEVQKAIITLIQLCAAINKLNMRKQAHVYVSAMTYTYMYIHVHTFILETCVEHKMHAKHCEGRHYNAGGLITH